MLEIYVSVFAYGRINCSKFMQRSRQGKEEVDKQQFSYFSLLLLNTKLMNYTKDY